MQPNDIMCCVIHLAGSQESVHIEQEDDLGKFDDMEPNGKEGSLSEDEIIPGVCYKLCSAYL